ncbi:MAG: methytransferase partner Trm112 [Methanocorpusculum sp.]|nr:methytransferase partner Trm112 [Methanocorpusculum sp.]
MNRWILEYLCCPVCKGELTLLETEGAGTEISCGTLTCTKCGKSYPVENGIADLLPERGD